MTCIDDGCSTHHHISNAPHWRQIKKSHPEHSALRNSIEAYWITPITPHGITEFFQTMAPQHPRMIQMKASVNGAGTKPGETRQIPRPRPRPPRSLQAAPMASFYFFPRCSLKIKYLGQMDAKIYVSSRDREIPGRRARSL